MGSFKGDKRNPGRDRRRPAGGRSRGDLGPERLEERTLLSQTPMIFGSPALDANAIKHDPVAKVAGQHLYQIDQAFRTQRDFPQVLAEAQRLFQTRGEKIGVDAYGVGDFAAFERTLRGLGMEVVATDSSIGLVEGYLPVTQIRAAATFAQTRGLHPILKPFSRQQGVADNQGDRTLAADQARALFNVDGTGVTVGVLSDSVNRVGGGLADSQATGDLPPNINVLLDGNPGQSDEGRAMLELIHDIAPGASLAYHTATIGGPAGFADGIRALARQAGARVIVDDIGYSNEPVFQDGLVGRAVIDVTTNNNATYFSAAGNDGDGGYESDVRVVTATVGNVGAGTFHDFDPGPGVLSALPITVGAGGSNLILWWDDPWFTGAAQSDVDLFVLDAAGVAIVAQAVVNNIGSAQPQEFIPTLAAGNYQVAVRYTGGPAPQRIRFQSLGGATVTVDQRFGSAGGTTYPTTFAHPTSPAAIGVAAVDYRNAPPVSAATPIPTEPFTSAGPVVYFFDAAGQRQPRRLLLKPDVAGPDGVDTTFFGSPDVDGTGFPNFFGTSAAAPNVAAVAALMKQLNPSLSSEDVREAMATTATPVNGTPPRVWDLRGGFGLVNAVAALTAVDQLRVVASTPADLEVLGQAPSFVELRFSKPINPATLQAGDLTFPVLPPGVTVQVGNPTLLNPQTVRFPITIDAPPEVDANGVFAFELLAGTITATDGSPLVGLRRAFTLADSVAPRVRNTIFQGRIVVVEFTEAMRPSTITKNTVQLIRSGWTGTFGRPENVIVTDDPRVTFFYDAENNRAIYDLRGIPQSLIPSDFYALVVTDEARDVAGNRLDGNFFGQFPTGDGQAGGTFAQPFARLVEAPQVVGFGLAAGSDTGVPGDRGTNLARPSFSGFVVATFPATNAGVQVAIQYIQDRPGGFDLDVDPNGRGFVGTPDQIVTTDENGFFRFEPPFNLRDGFHRVRIVVVGEAEFPPVPGRSIRLDQSFRVDTTRPLVTASSIPSESRVPNLRNITLNFADPVAPADPNDPLAVPVQLDTPALDPGTATNLSNYSLINLGPDRVLGTADDVDLSRFIQEATFSSTSARLQPGDPYTGRVELTFADGLPSGRYVLVARTLEAGFSGIRDDAGNPLDNDPAQAGNQSFATFFELQPEPAYITGFTAFSPSAFNPGTLAASGPREFYETPVAGFAPRAEAPPQFFQIDFSNTLAPRDYTGAVQLIRSADSPTAAPDGDFGLGVGGFTPVPGITVELTNSVPGAVLGQPGFLNRLVVRVPAGQALPADYYRLVIPNAGAQEIRDIFGNLADLEFLGNEKPQDEGFEVFMPDGTFRDGLTGDAVAGGTFVTGFVVTPGQRLGADGRIRGNVIHARPDYEDDPFLLEDDPDGSILRPFPALVPEAVPNLLNQGDLNSAVNFGTGFNPRFDRNANGRFDRSAFFEAEQNGALGPVVVVALPGIERPVPGTTQTTRQTFVIAPPAGADPTRPENNASASVPELTTLVFDAGSALKLFNASLFVQNQGSALQVRGGGSPGEQVFFTSLLDDSVGGAAGFSDANPRGGDWGGIVFRNYDDVSEGRGALPGQFPVDGKLGLSGASDVMSAINGATIRFGGGAVPQTIGERFDSITLFNSRPAITNTVVADSAGVGAAGGSQAAISADLDSLREDEVARGPLIRRARFVNNSINGVLIRPPVGSLQAQETDSQFFPANPTTLGGGRNFVIDDPVPYVLASQLVLGQRLLRNTGGQTDETVSSRLYVQPGMMVKSRIGAGIAVINLNSSINIGDRTYIDQFDRNPDFAPTDPDFRPNTVGDAKPLFTSLFDDAAETFFFDQATGVRRVIVPAGPTDNDTTNPAPAPGNVTPALRWGSLSIIPGARAVIDEAEFRYGGSQVVTPIGILPNRQVLDLTNDIATFVGYAAPPINVGARVSITNNDFYDNFDAPIVVEPNQLLAADPLRPLSSGNPFFRGNVMERNSINGMAIKAFQGIVVPDPSIQGDFFGEAIVDDVSNLQVNSVWDDTDIVHVLRGTIALAGWFNGAGTKPVPSATEYLPELQPAVALTIQSALPDTLLANGDRVARPGEEMFVKLFNDTPVGNAGPGDAIDPDLGSQAAADNLDFFGAGFQVGFDDGVDPPSPASPLIEPGYGSQLRIVGIGANETTGQQRVPVVMTSLRDNTAGPVVRGVSLANTFSGDFRPNRNLSGAALTTPEPGDGGIIGFGGGSLFDYNLYDPRNGSLIDNADIRFIHRIEFQGGGIVDAFDLNASNAIDEPDDPRSQRHGRVGFFGDFSPALQYNAPHGWTVSNSSLADFRDAGIFADQGFDLIARIITQVGDTVFAGFPARASGQRGQPTNLFLVNNTISNMPVGVRINSTTGNNLTGQSPPQIVMLHNTFYNNGVAFRTEAPDFASPPPNSLSHIFFMAMNNIFDGGTIGGDPAAAAIRLEGMVARSEMVFNLFHNYATVLDNQISPIPGAPFRGNNAPIFGDPRFLDPQSRNFFLQPGSSAIDAALSELGPHPIGDMLFPISNQLLDPRGGIRNTIGRTDPFGGLSFFADDPRKIITLPGTPGRAFADQFIPSIPGTPGSSLGPATNLASFAFSPLIGERDKEGFLRIDDPNTPNLGFGSRPFFDVGAREFRVFDPPVVTPVGAPDVSGDGLGDPVIATLARPEGGVDLVPLYLPGSVAGTNRVPQAITVQFDKRLDLQSVNSQTVLLQASGGDGIFGNANSPADRFIPLSGRLAFDPTTRRLSISLANLPLTNDLYRIILVGSGANVLRDPQGNALDGENLGPDGLPRDLRDRDSGDGFPGGNFVLPFTIDTRPPAIVPGTFRLSPSADPTLQITNANPPSFTGNVTDLFPPVNPLINQRVVLDVDTNGDGVFDLPNVGTALTDAAGNFVVTVNQTLPDTNFDVGPDGILGTADDSGYSRARVRITDVAGNVSDPADPNATIQFILDTRSPQVIETTPAPGTQVSPGTFTVSITVDENLALASLLAPGAIVAIGAGPDGVFGTGDDRPATVDLGSLNVEFLGGTPRGPSRISFNVTGVTTTDIYRVALTRAVTDRAGNPVAGDGFNLDVVLFSPGQERRFFVGPPTSGSPTGSRTNPFPTIAAGLAAATVGDTVAVLPGTYNEAVTLKSLVRLVSADPSSTDGAIVPGSAQATIIRAPLNASAPEVTVRGTDLIGIGGDLDTELRGFAIASPLTNLATGAIQTDTVGLQLINSGGLFHRNLIINGAQGITVVPRNGAEANARIESNVIAGNLTGLVITDTANTAAINRPVRVANNTVVLNGTGASISDQSLNPNFVIADVVNNIFWQNNDRTANAQDAHLVVNPPVAVVRSNMFGSNPNNPLLGFDASALGPVPNGAAANNFIGEPAFLAPRDPRPQFDGPTITLLDANFGLSAGSAAIDAADQNAAPALDFLGRGRVDIAGRGFPGLGPADVGAFEFLGAAGGPGSGFQPPIGGQPGSPVLFSEPSPVPAPSNPTVTFQPGAGTGVGVAQAAQTAGSQATAGQARRDRVALRNLLAGQKAKVSEVAPTANRAWNDLIAKTRFRRGN